CPRLGRAESRPRCARVASDRTAPLRSATRPEGRRHLQPNVEIACGEVSCWPPKGSQTISKPKTVRERCKCEFGLARNGTAEMIRRWSAFSASAYRRTCDLLCAGI